MTPVISRDIIASRDFQHEFRATFSVFTLLADNGLQYSICNIFNPQLSCSELLLCMPRSKCGVVWQLCSISWTPQGCGLKILEHGPEPRTLHMPLKFFSLSISHTLQPCVFLLTFASQQSRWCRDFAIKGDHGTESRVSPAVAIQSSYIAWYHIQLISKL